MSQIATLDPNETDAREHSLLGLAILLLAATLSVVITLAIIVIQGTNAIILIFGTIPYLAGGIAYMAMLYTRP